MPLGSALPQPQPASTGTVYYVGAGGNDANTATQAQNSATPWLTIQNAVSKAAAANVNGGWTIKLKTDKTYSETCYINNFANLNGTQTVGGHTVIGAVNPCTITADYNAVPGDKGVLAQVTAQIKTYKVGNLRFSYLDMGGVTDFGFMLLGPFGQMTTDTISSTSQGWMTIEYCEIHDTSASGIFAGGANGAGAFNTEDANDLHIVNNYIHGCGRATTNNAAGFDHALYHAHGYRIYFANNIVLDNPSGNAVQLQPESNGGLVTANTIVGSPYQISVSGDGSVYLPASNIYGLGAVQRPSSNNTIVNNILAHAPATLTATQNPNGLNYGHAIDTFWGGSTGTGNVAENNQIFRNLRGDTTVSGGGMTFTGNQVGDPLFTSDFDETTGYGGSSYIWSATTGSGTTWNGPNHDGTRDVHPLAASPAGGLAIDTLLPTTDYDGVTRTSLTAGALEIPAAGGGGGGGGVITLVQSNVISYGGSANEGSHVFSIPSNVAAGDTLILTVGANATPANAHLTGVTDTKGNAWQIDSQSTGTTNGENNAIASAHMTSGLVAGTDTITVTMSSANATLTVYCDEWSGIATSSWLDQVATPSEQAAVTTATSGSVTTTQAVELLISLTETTGTTTATVTSPWTARKINLSPTGSFIRTQHSEYQIVSSTGTYSSSIGLSASTNTETLLATYKAAPVGGGGGNSPNLLLLGVG